MDPKKVVEAARSAASLGAHDPGPHADHIGDHEGPHHLGAVAGVLRKAGLAKVPSTVAELVELAQKSGAWVEPKVSAFGSFDRPEAGDVVVLAAGTPGEHTYVVCSVSEHHLESLEGGAQARRYGIHNGKPVKELGGDLIEYRSRQLAAFVPVDDEGNSLSAQGYVLDGAHAHLPEKQQQPRRVSGYVRVSKLRDGAATTAPKSIAPKAPEPTAAA